MEPPRRQGRVSEVVAAAASRPKRLQRGDDARNLPEAGRVGEADIIQNFPDLPQGPAALVVDHVPHDLPGVIAAHHDGRPASASTRARI